MRIHTLQSEVRLNRPIDEVFAFFSNAHNLDMLTPKWLHFEVLSPADLLIQPGVLIDYRLRWHGIPMRWRTEITKWQPPCRFVDRMVRGPYKQWLHEHRFTKDGDATIMTDRVDYAVHGFFFEPLIHKWFVGPDVRSVFAYRSEAIKRQFGEAAK